MTRNFPVEDVANAGELTRIVDKLEERVTNHIKFFWVVVGFGFLWLGSVTALLIRVDSNVNQVQRASADAPARIVASLLDGQSIDKYNAPQRLAAAASILKTEKPGIMRPSPGAV